MEFIWPPPVSARLAASDSGASLAPRRRSTRAEVCVPATLVGLLAEVARVYVPVMLANARALLTRAERVETEVDGRLWVQNPFPYQARRLKWLREEYAALSAGDQAAAMRILDLAGCAALIREAL